MELLVFRLVDVFILEPCTLADRWLCSETRCSGCGGGALLCFPQNGGAPLFFSLFFCRVPELVGTFRWHCYPARFLRPAAFVRLSPIVPASFVPRLQQWLFSFLSLPLNIYVHFLPLCILFVLFCCLLCFSFLPPQSWEIIERTHTHTHTHTHTRTNKPVLICSSSLCFKPLSVNLSSLPFSLLLSH